MAEMQPLFPPDMQQPFPHQEAYTPQYDIPQQQFAYLPQAQQQEYPLQQHSQQPLQPQFQFQPEAYPQGPVQGPSGYGGQQIGPEAAQGPQLQQQAFANEHADAPPVPAPAQQGFFSRLASLFRLGLNQQAGADGQALALAGASVPLDQHGDFHNPEDATTLSYALAFKVHEDDPRLEDALLMRFDKTALGGPMPQAQREQVMRITRMPKEELGLYTERQPSLGLHSLFKMEQRVAKAVTLDKQFIQSLVVGSEATEAAAAHAAARHRRNHEHKRHGQAHVPDSKQLVVGALPSLLEEEGEGQEGVHGSQTSQLRASLPGGHVNLGHPGSQVNPGQQQAGVLGLGPQTQGLLSLGPPHITQLQPAMPGDTMIHAAIRPMLMNDPQQVWSALQYHQQGLMQVGALEPSHPNHQQLAAVNAAVQQMAAGGPLPAVGMDGLPVPPDALPVLRPSPFLDEDGLLTYTVDPVKAEKQRPARRYDQDKESNRTYRRLPIVEGVGAAVSEAAHTYRLDIELGRMEFLVHPSMAQEDLLAARLLAAYKEFKRSESVGLASFYGNKLAALENALLAARELLFELSEQAAIAAAASAPVAAAMAADDTTNPQLAAAAEAAAQGDAMSDELRTALDNTIRLEMEVAETRQLKEEDELFMIRAVESMQVIYAAIVLERQSQGYWRTQVELTVQQRPPEEQQWAMGTGVPRDRLDALLLVAEVEAISGLPPPPLGFPLPPALDGLPEGGFRPRRLESMCASHKMLVAQLRNRLDDLKGRPTADPYDPVQMQLEDQLRALSAAPRRLGPRTPEERAAAHDMATHRVLSGDVGVPRFPRLVPILTAAQEKHPTGGQPQQTGQQPNATGGTENNTKPPAGHKHTGPKCRYYVRLFVNNHYVDTSQPVGVGEDYTGQFKDVFSVQVVRWPQSITLQLYEKGTVRDVQVATLYVGVPGLAGAPHVDPRPLPYQFTSQAPMRIQGPGQLSPPGSPGRGGFGPANDTSMVYPAGVVHVRCGWVAQWAEAGARMDDVQGSMRTFTNPLAEAQRDVEAPGSVMPPLPHITVDRMLRRAAERIGGKVNRQQIMKWLSQNKVDPNDPRNAPLIELMRAQEATSGGLGELFRLDVFPDIAITKSRQQDKRLSFLTRRWASGPFRDPERSVLKGTRHVRIPAVLSARDTEDLEHLYLDALALVELVPGGSGPAIARAMIERADRATRTQIGAELSKGVEERESRIKDYALRIRAAANRIAGGKQAVRSYKTDDVVNDLPLPEFKVDLSTLTRIVAPRRPLKRERKVLKSMQTSVPADTELMVTVQRATNLPKRRGTTSVSHGAARPARGGRGDDSTVSDQHVAETKGTSVCAFVEVRFRGLSTRTVTSSTNFPTFNEMMTLPVFSAEEEPSSRSLYENSDVVTINVFDEVINDRVGEPRVTRTNKEDAISDPVRYPERERRFLGCTHVPLSAVYQTQVLEGTFKLEVPPVLLGYTQGSERPPCITMVLSLKPKLAPPSELSDHLLSGEMEDVTRYARTWLAELHELSQCRTRVIRVLAVDPDGTSLLVTRFVAATHLPPHIVTAAMSAPVNLPGISHTEEVMLKAARFVSLVPYLEDSALQKRRVDVWSTNAEALYLGAGDAEEHAHLLAGYFLELGQQAFVVMGTSTFGARSYFVLTTGHAEFGSTHQQAVGAAAFNWNELQLRLWNPLSGGVTSVKDVTGELREVGAIYNHSNVWANTQVAGAPWEIHWQLNDSRYWKPFFGMMLPPRELGTVQTPVTYEDRPPLFYEQLETRIEEAARDALSKARALGAFVTKPDNKVSRVLKTLLREMPDAIQVVSAASLAASLEVAQLGSVTVAPTLGNGLNERHRAIASLQDHHNERVGREVRSDWVHGHILAIPFSDKYIDAVSEAVLNTGLHRVADERVKYSVAALVEQGGAAFCCCIWLYIAATR